MFKEKNNVSKEGIHKTNLWSKFTKWIVSKFTTLNKYTQDEIREHLEDIGEDILAPIIDKGADLLENIVIEHVPGVGGQILTNIIDSTGDSMAEMLGGKITSEEDLE